MKTIRHRQDRPDRLDHETLRGIGQRLKEEARRCGLSQSDIGRLLGVTRAAVNHWMGGKNAPEVAQLVRLGHETSISLGYVLIGAPQDKPEILDLARRLAAVPARNIPSRVGQKIIVYARLTLLAPRV